MAKFNRREFGSMAAAAAGLGLIADKGLEKLKKPAPKTVEIKTSDRTFDIVREKAANQQELQYYIRNVEEFFWEVKTTRTSFIKSPKEYKGLGASLLRSSLQELQEEFRILVLIKENLNHKNEDWIKEELVKISELISEINEFYSAAYQEVSVYESEIKPQE